MPRTCFSTVLSVTHSRFAILAFEAPELHRIVDLMRELRATDARRHTRLEIPFFTGPRVSVEQLVDKLP